MVIMSVDYGDARTGIAICDRLESLAHPVEVIKQSYEPKVLERIKELADINKLFYSFQNLWLIALFDNLDRMSQTFKAVAYRYARPRITVIDRHNNHATASVLFSYFNRPCLRRRPYRYPAEQVRK